MQVLVLLALVVTLSACTAAWTRPELKEGVTTLVIEQEIAAPVDVVWSTMFSADTYPVWTEPFSAGSYFEGSWSEGEEMRFLGPGESGMLARVASRRDHELMAIEHFGMVMEGEEDTTSENVTSWAPAYEVYRFAATATGTRVTVEQDILAGMEDSMRATWEKSLAKLAELCGPR